MEDTAGSNGLARTLFPEGVRESFLKHHLDQASAESLLPGVAPSADRDLILAALYLFNDDLDPSHEICQRFDRECIPANYWHGIIHRREPDFPNAKGWYGRAESWTGLLQIRDRVQDVLERVLLMPEYGEARDTAFRLKQHLDTTGNWDPGYFVDMCADYREKASPDRTEGALLQEIQEAEMVAALDWTYRCAVG